MLGSSTAFQSCPSVCPTSTLLWTRNVSIPCVSVCLFALFQSSYRLSQKATNGLEYLCLMIYDISYVLWLMSYLMSYDLCLMSHLMMSDVTCSHGFGFGLCLAFRTCDPVARVDALFSIDMSLFTHSYYIWGTSTPNGGFHTPPTFMHCENQSKMQLRRK